MSGIQGVTQTTEITSVSAVHTQDPAKAPFQSNTRSQGESQSSLQPSEHQVTDQEINRSLERVKKVLKESNTTVHLEWNKDIDRVVMKVISNDTGELVKQIPPQQFIDREVEYLRLIGLLVDKKA